MIIIIIIITNVTCLNQQLQGHGTAVRLQIKRISFKCFSKAEIDDKLVMFRKGLSRWELLQRLPTVF